MCFRALCLIYFASVLLRAEPAPERNIATSEYGAFVFTSSVADLEAAYSDHLIDGDVKSAWSAGSRHMPQWVEIRWPYAETITGVELHSVDGSSIKAWRWAWFDNDHWQNGGAVTEKTSVRFPAVSTSRIRIYIDQGTIPVRLHPIEVMGLPLQPLENLRAYWSANYIWYPEKDHQIHVGSARWFRKSFTVEDSSRIDLALLQSRSNDGYIAYLNGQEVSKGSTNIFAVDVRKSLRQGENIIAYRATAGSDPGWGNMELLGELVLQANGKRTVIGTDGSWSASETDAPGWNLPNAASDGWKPVSVLARPPGGPWGAITYPSSGCRLPATVHGLSVMPPTARPGEKVKVRLDLSLPHEVAGNFLFEFRLGDFPYRADMVDFTLVRGAIVPTPALSTWKVGEVHSVETELCLPQWSPGRKLSILVDAIALDKSGRQLYLDFPPDSASLSIVRDPEPAAPSPLPARIIQEGTRAGFSLGGQTVPPIFWGGSQFWTYEKIAAYAKGGPKVFEVSTYPLKIDDDTDYNSIHFALLENVITNIRALVPDASFLVSGDLRTTAAWKAAHPEGLLLDGFGHPLMESLISQAYAKTARNYVTRLADFVASRPWGNRVIGYRFMFCGQPDAAIGGVSGNAGVIDRARWTVGDWNPDALEGFRAFLREKYGNDDKALRASWRDPAADFSTASPILSELTKAPGNGGLFPDPNRGAAVSDYFAYISSILPGSFDRIVGDVLTGKAGNDIFIASWAGYMPEILRGLQPCSVQQSNTFALEHSGFASKINLFTGTTSYSTRQPGFRMSPFQPFKSEALHGKLPMIELDYRTFLAGAKERGRQKSEAETRAVFRREMGTAMLNGAGFYFWEFAERMGRMSLGYFMDDGLLREIRRSYDLYQELLESPHPPVSTAQMAVVFSPETIWHQDVEAPAVVYNNLIVNFLYTELAGIGAPCDILQVNDLALPEVRRRYKLIIFANAFHLSPAQRGWVDDLKRDGRLLCWFYAPGYIDDQKGLSVEALSSLIGMEAKAIDAPEAPEFTPAGSNPIVRDLHRPVRIAPLGQAANLNRLSPVAFSPNFEVTDPMAIPLGRDSQGRIRFALREEKNWQSLYCAVPNLPRLLLRRIAIAAGVHLYAPEGIVVEANSRYLLIHHDGKEARQIVLNLPEECRLEGLFDGSFLTTDAQHATLALPDEPYTELYRIIPKGGIQ